MTNEMSIRAELRSKQARRSEVGAYLGAIGAKYEQVDARLRDLEVESIYGVFDLLYRYALARKKERYSKEIVHFNAEFEALDSVCGTLERKLAQIEGEKDEKAIDEACERENATVEAGADNISMHLGDDNQMSR